jgi:hypothetical protein
LPVKENLRMEDISRRDWLLVMHATIRCRTFCPHACCQKMWRLEYARL